MTVRLVSTKQFERDLQKFIKQTKIAADTVARQLTQEIFEGVVQRTPVDTGWARSNWLVAGGARPTESPGPRPAKENVIAAPKFPGVAPDQGTYWVVNNVEYIVPLEEGRSKQIGKGFMVRRTVVASQTRIKRFVLALK